MTTSPAAQRTRSALVAAAAEVFARLGYAHTTIADIAGAAGTSRPSFYQYFTSKDEIFEAVVAQLHERLIEVQDVPDVDPGDIASVAQCSIAAYLEAYVREQRLLVVLEHQSLDDPALRALYDEIVEHAGARAQRFIERAIREGGARPAASPEALVRALAGMVVRFADHVRQNPAVREQAGLELGQIFVALLGLPNPSPSPKGADRRSGGRPPS